VVNYLPRSCPYTGSTITVYGDVYIGSFVPEYLKSPDKKQGGNLCKLSGSHAMARYSAHSMLASLNIEDTPIAYSPPLGPAMDFTVTYNQRDTQQPFGFGYSNLGQKWTFNWLSYVTDNPNNSSANAFVYPPGGGAENYSGFNVGSQSFLACRTSTFLVLVGAVMYRLPQVDLESCLRSP